MSRGAVRWGFLYLATVAALLGGFFVCCALPPPGHFAALRIARAAVLLPDDPAAVEEVLRPVVRDSHDAQMWCGFAARRSGDRRDATRYFRMAARSNPGDWQAWDNLLQDPERLEPAERQEALRCLLSLQPDRARELRERMRDPRAASLVGAAARVIEKDPARAEEILKPIVAGDHEAQLWSGFAARRAGRTAAAAGYFRMAARSDPEDWQAWDNLLQDGGGLEPAEREEAYRQLARLRPDQAKRYREGIERRRGSGKNP